MDLPFFLALGVSFFLGLFSFWILQRSKLGSFQTLAKDILQKAEAEAASLQNRHEEQLRKRQIDSQQQQEKEWKRQRKYIEKEELRLSQREDKLEQRTDLLESKLSILERQKKVQELKEQDLQTLETTLRQQKEDLKQKLETLSGLSQHEAQTLLLNQIQAQVSTDAAKLSQTLIQEAKEDAEYQARQILAHAMSRLAVQTTSEISVMTIPLPNKELKGRIIGREGRNIQAFEQATGVNCFIDDTPNAVVLSGFDPVRKHIAREAIKELILDGRFHPTRIEEVVEKHRKQVEQEIRTAGQQAALKANVHHLHPELLKLLGKMHFRHSFGQNLLAHSLEVSYLLGIMAAELGLDQALARRIGLLHDMGKAVSHEIEGTHALIGHRLALKYGESDIVANGIGCHHGEMDPLSIEGSLCGAADALSAARPGARVEAVDSYIKRLEQLEQLAKKYPGVQQVYAMQAGREVRVIVQPNLVDDIKAVNLSRELAHKIEETMSYPGKVKVTIIRETRAVSYAV